jgi:hypothetical protein
LENSRILFFSFIHFLNISLLWWLLHVGLCIDRSEGQGLRQRPKTPVKNLRGVVDRARKKKNILLEIT